MNLPLERRNTMKNKNCLRWLCAMLILVLLTGCGTVTPTDPAVTTAPEPTLESTAGTTEPVDHWQKVKELAGEVPAYVPGEPLIEYDPDREIFIALGNEEIDIFPDPRGAMGADFYIYSRHPLTEEDIQIHIPCNTPLVKYYRDHSSAMTSDSSNKKEGEFDNYVELCIAGADFRQYTQNNLWMSAAATLYRDCLWANELDDAKKYREIYDACDAQAEIFKSELGNSEVGNVPSEPIYVYFLMLVCENNELIYDETVESIEITIKGKTYIVDVGQWRFHSQLPNELQDTLESPKGVEDFTYFPKVVMCYPYIDYVQTRELFDFTAAEDLTITGCRQPYMEDPLNVLGARIQIQGSTNTDFYWDLQRPVNIKKGDHVTVELYFKDNRFQEYLMEFVTLVTLDYDIRGKSHSMGILLDLLRSGNVFWNPYLLAFEGVDIGNYYTCYHRPSCESWIDELPEAWRE